MNFASELSGNFIKVSFVVEIFIVPPMSKSTMLERFAICLEISLFFSQRFFFFFDFGHFVSAEVQKLCDFFVDIFSFGV